MTTLMPIKRASLHDQIVAVLREQIVSGVLEPNEKLNEQALCKQFGVSRTPLREALKVLSAEGLVRITQHYGASVTDLTLGDLEEVFPIMAALEALSGRLACAHVTDAEINRIEKLHRQMVAHYKARNRERYFECNQAIHEAILKAARNPTLAGMMRGLAVRLRRARYRANISEARWAKAVEEHERILRTLKARDAEALSRELGTHLENKLASIRDALQPDGAVQG